MYILNSVVNEATLGNTSYTLTLYGGGGFCMMCRLLVP